LKSALLFSLGLHAALALLCWHRTPLPTGIPLGRPTVELWTEGFGKKSGQVGRKNGAEAEPALLEPAAPAGDTSGGTEGITAVELKDLMGEKNHRPAYPQEALERGWTGNVRLLVRHKNGHVEEVTVLHRSSHECFETSARQAVLQWEIPAHLPEKIAFTLLFHLKNSDNH